MITLTIDNPEMEKVFYEKFNGDNDSFVEYLSQSYYANNSDYNTIDIATLEKLYEEGTASGDSGLTHEEVFDMLFKKYDID